MRTRAQAAVQGEPSRQNSTLPSILRVFGPFGWRQRHGVSDTWAKRPAEITGPIPVIDSAQRPTGCAAEYAARADLMLRSSTKELLASQHNNWVGYWASRYGQAL